MMRRLRLCVICFVCLMVLTALLGGGLVALGAFRYGAAGWYFHTDSDYRLSCGQSSLRRGDSARLERVATQLENAGAPEHAALLRAEALFQTAEPYVKANQPAKSTPLLQQAVNELAKIKSLGNLRVQAVSLYGRCSLYLKDLKTAENAFHSLLSQDPDHLDAHRGLAAVYFDQGSLTKSIYHLLKVAELDPHDSRPYRLIGVIYKDLQMFGPAADAYREALEHGVVVTEQPVVRQELAACLIKHSKYAEGLDIIDQLQPSDEVNPAVEALRAEALAALGRTEDAKAVLEDALKNSSGNADLHRLRGLLDLQQNRPQEAATRFERALVLDPNDVGSRYQLALAYRRLGKKVEAEKQEQRVHETQKDLDLLTRLNQEAGDKPWDESVRRKMAEVCERFGKLDEAAMWRRAADACANRGQGSEDRRQGSGVRGQGNE
jgi:tetratricopeptide (TPR) repeat protein